MGPTKRPYGSQIMPMELLAGNFMQALSIGIGPTKKLDINNILDVSRFHIKLLYFWPVLFIEKARLLPYKRSLLTTGEISQTF